VCDLSGLRMGSRGLDADGIARQGFAQMGEPMLIETRPIGKIFSVVIDGLKTDITIIRDTSGKEDILTCSLSVVKPAKDFNELCEGIEKGLKENYYNIPRKG